jgi:hypothetical protein
MEKIYVKDGETAKNIVELLRISIGDYYFRETFSDPELSVRQCHKARRSFEDLYAMCLTYFPETTELDLGAAMREFIDTGVLTCLYCTHINRWVWLNSGHRLFDPIDNVNIDALLDGHSIYTEKYLRNLLGF